MSKSGGKKGERRITAFLGNKRFNDLITNDLIVRTKNPISFNTNTSAGMALGDVILSVKDNTSFNGWLLWEQTKP